ncbi:MAG: hypothetical protein ABEI97_05200, partial [Candidatus Nanohaloarchaea archaeon]
MRQELERKEAVQELTAEGCIIEPAAVERLEAEHVDKIKQLSPAPMVVNERLLENLDTGEVALETSVEVLTEIEEEKEKRDVNDFVNFYNDRYEKIKTLLLRRRDIQNAVSISRLEDMQERDDASV